MIEAYRNLMNAFVEVRHVQKTLGSGQPVIEANKALVVPAALALKEEITAALRGGMTYAEIVKLGIPKEFLI